MALHHSPKAIPGEDASKEDQIEGLVNNVKWQMSADRKVGALKQLQGLIWKQGYDKGGLKGHVFDDVSTALERWHSIEGQKVHLFIRLRCEETGRETLFTKNYGRQICTLK
ncbi:unnamed protein product [Danaus chrysippus]|uniref:(African queen) hypothetical protein n=1 Tax=Danaus chrysippus TaxID=151541 RepID=A0A8J2R0H7_9NEOP|nr:unnamed protein product [Danaus chrysippus]